MDLEFVTEGTSEDDNFRVDDINEEYSNFEGERCGICMDTVIDRGLLDCCQHWFCFTCIDNWATITNLCPLCQNEFQLITCVPVYDTIGGTKTHEDSCTRDDDWCIEGKNNTLSFPSYYINENAVVCLEADGCKIRCGSATIETDSNLDTSIACDSCDIWYHAFCVGFDPEGACESSWLCPRCVVNQQPPKLDDIAVPGSSNHHVAENIGSDCSVQGAFSGKVSVSVADVGETAVVVSLVEENQNKEDFDGQISTLDFSKGAKVDTLLPSSVAVAPKAGELSSERIICELNSESEELELSLSRDTCASSAPSFVSNLKINTDDKGAEEPRLIDGLGISSTKSSATPFNDKLLESGLDLDLGLSVSSSSDADRMIKITETQVPGYDEDKSSLGNLLSADEKIPEKELSVGGMAPDEKNVSVNTGAKRKHRDDRNVHDEEGKTKTEAKFSLKKVKVEGTSQLMHLKDQAIDSIAEDSRNSSAVTTVKDSETKSVFAQKNIVTDIMDIVRGTGHKRSKQHAHANFTKTSSKESENAAGLRVKKIMRTSDDADSSILVQKLRKEIREAVRNKSCKDIGENLFDPKLLAAFRAVVAGSAGETKKPPPDVKAKKVMLQKGKVREKLTKKIYGMGGRRRHAWTRDCEIEFWKHRCSKISKPEKIQTLQSVLDLLRNGTDKTVTKHAEEGDATGSILSRLYLADTSVFPRKHDIKPVSAHKDVTFNVQNKNQSLPQDSEKIPLRSEVSTKIVAPPLLDGKLTKKSFSDQKVENASHKLLRNKCTEGATMSGPSGLKASSHQEIVGTSDSTRSDKRKWALEVLARKTAVVERNATQEKEDDSTMLKGNYPLLGQLPKDMRPVLASIRHNKIPMAVRQAQLYRIAEHFLRKANLQVMCRTAVTELAVADAINIEREIADRSNSKLVYVNLCSQELSRKSDNTNPGRAAETNVSSTSVVRADGAEVVSDAFPDPEVHEALKSAGLLADTPPNSPYQPMEEIEEDTDLLKKVEDNGLDNVFETDSPSEYDIYGDFEYNLEDDDFIGAGALKISKLQSEESKMKVVFSTFNAEKLNGIPEVPNQEGSASHETSKGTFNWHQCPTSTGSSNMDIRKNNSLPQNSFVDEDCEEPSLAECEELYGPDKEPLIEKYPETAVMTPYEVIGRQEVIAGTGNHESCEPIKESDPQTESFMENSEVMNLQKHLSGSETSLSHTEKNEHVQTEKNSGANISKHCGSSNLVSKKVEAYIKEHIRPLCKSGVITVEQYKWAAGKTTEKVMKYHSKDKNANFLIKEGEKVKKLAEQYVEAARQMSNI